MSVTENIERIEQGKTSIISSIKSKGVNVPSGVLINEIAPYINEIQGGGDVPDTPKTELEQKYEGATVFRINVPTDNYEFAINLCNDATKATYDVDWGDGSLESGLTTDEQHHTYTKAGIYDINIYNLSKDITLGGGITEDDGLGNSFYLNYLFNNTNNDYWSIGYVNIRDLIIIDILIGDKITSIGDYVFQNCSGLTSITIPDSVTSIGQYAFYSCSSLTSITIPNGVTSIGERAFWNCSSLTSITIPNGVTSISSYAFYNCSSLQSVVITEGVTTISSSAFYGCSSLQSVVIPEGVTSIGSYAFYNCSSLQSVVIPEGVTSIGNYAFQYCSRLTAVTIPNSVTSISSYAFSNCSSLQSVVIPEGVTSIRDYAFQYCSRLTNITIPDSVTSIRDYAFQYCSRLTNITIPDSVTIIGNYAFYSCSSLTSITIPNSVTYIGNHAFYSCYFLQSITCELLTAPTIQSNTFPTSAFKYTKRYLYVPKDSVGYNEGNWKTYLIDKGWELRYIEEHVKTPTTMKLKTVNNFLHKWGCIGGANLVDYELVNDEYIYHFDDKIQEIKQYTFYKKVLEEIELPEGVTSIGSDAFSSCSSLQSVVIPEGVTTIGSDAFSSCSSLQSVVIPEGVTTISSSAFYGCSSLQSVVIPEGVTSIGSYAFYNCSSLQSITINALTAPTIQSNTFNNVGSSVPSGTPKILRVPKGATGYDEGNWKTYLIAKGYTLEYIE